MREERIKNILTNLSDKYISSEVLASLVGVSSKTIRNEIKDISNVIQKHGAIIESKPKKGIRIIINDKISFLEYLDSLTEIKENETPSSFEERVQFLLEYLLNTKEWIKIDDLCEMLYISQSSLSQCLKEVRARLKEYNIRLISKPGYGLHIEASEFDLRLCIANLIVDRLDKNSLSQSLEFMDNKKEVLKKISNILNQVFELFDFHMADVSFHNLVVHIYVTLCRVREQRGTVLTSNQLKEISQWKEYGIAQNIIALLERQFEISIPRDEICYVSIHLAAKKILDIENASENIIITEEIYEMVSHMLQAVYDAYHIDLTDDLELRMMLSLHLVPFGIRMDYDLVLHNPLLKDIKTKYTMAYNLAVVASDELSKHYNKKVNEDEIGYFALHFNLALERKNKNQDKKNIVIVCGTGRGTAQLFMYQFKEKFGKYLNKIYTSDALSIKNMDFSDVDYIVTTVPISIKIPVPILEIKTFVEENDVKTIKRFLSQKNSGFMDKYFARELFLTDVHAESKEEVLQFMVSKIKEVYLNLPFDFYDAIMYREEQADTEFGNLVAIPHPYKAMTDRTFVCVCILEKPIVWHKKKVQLIYLMSMENNPDRDLMTFYKITSKLLVNPQYVRELVISKKYETLIELFTKIEDTLE